MPLTIVQVIYRQHAREEGFSLLELVIALFILAIGFVGAFSLFTKSIVVSREIKNEIIAGNLAAEAIEVIINIRDTNWLKDPPDPYDDFDGNGLSDTFPVANTNVEYNSTSTQYIIDDRLYLDSTSGDLFYTHNSSGEPTPFSRWVEIRSLLDDDSVSYREVKSIVMWTQFGVTKRLELIDHLYDWKPE